jgi:hypothetical protein
MANKTRVYLEIGQKRVFACAVDWPGWCRSGKDEGQALEALIQYAPRYAVVAREAGEPFDEETARNLEVVERVPGSTTTDFGAPDKAIPVDFGSLDKRQAERLAALLSGSWTLFDQTVARAPASLTKGPRGGGRDRDRIVDHILGADASYARKIGLKHRQPERTDTSGIAALRNAVLDTVRSGEQTHLVDDKRWPLPYIVRRIAWHVIDHAWEIEDRGGLTAEKAW